MVENEHKVTQPINEKIRNRVLSVMFISGIFQIIAALIHIIFGMLALIAFYDIFYWPPFMIYRLKEMPYWVTFGIILMILTFLQMGFTIYWKIKPNAESYDHFGKYFVLYQLFYFPFGTLFGVYEYQWMRLYNLKGENQIGENGLIKNSNKEIGKALIWTGVIYLSCLCLVYLLTIYLSTMMLDITYPFLTMSILFEIRKILLILAILCGLQMGYGFLYINKPTSLIIRILGYIIGIVQIPLIPIGTVMGLNLLRDLKSKKDYMS